MEDYNLMSKAPMDLVMFRFAIEHVSRLSRVLKQPNGHCLCVGTKHFERSFLGCFHQKQTQHVDLIFERDDI